MRIRPGVLIATVAVFAVLIGGRFLGWYGGKPVEVTVTGEPPEDAAPSTSGTPPAAVPQPPTPAAPIADWKKKIDDILTAQEEDGQKATRLLAMFPNLPEDGQVEAAQLISKLLPDEQYSSLAQALTNAAMPEAVLDVLMTDVLKRPNQIKLETLFDVARTPNHPKAEEALDLLEGFVDENYGQDWAAWKNAVEKWLKENPDEQRFGRGSGEGFLSASAAILPAIWSGSGSLPH
jgi:hypothetical protein